MAQPRRSARVRPSSGWRAQPSPASVCWRATRGGRCRLNATAAAAQPLHPDQFSTSSPWSLAAAPTPGVDPRRARHASCSDRDRTCTALPVDVPRRRLRCRPTRRPARHGRAPDAIRPVLQMRLARSISDLAAPWTSPNRRALKRRLDQHARLASRAPDAGGSRFQRSDGRHLGRVTRPARQRVR